MMKNITMMLLIGSLAGCMSMGTQVSDTQMSSLHKGVTTETEVIARLGQPNGVEQSSDGKKKFTYIFSKASPDAVSFIPVVGMFAGKTNSDSTIVTLNFNHAGILQDYNTTHTQMQAGMFNTASQSTAQ